MCEENNNISSRKIFTALHTTTLPSHSLSLTHSIALLAFFFLSNHSSKHQQQGKRKENERERAEYKEKKNIHKQPKENSL
jgi:hypothetical protein